MNDVLAVGEEEQSPEDYVRQLSSTTGLPHTLARRNMQRVHGVMTRMGNVLGGLTRGLDLSILDRGAGETGGHALSFFPRGDSLGVVLPSNSPGVHALWIPAVPLEVAARPEARRVGAVDAVPHHSGVRPRGRAARGVQLLPDRPRGRRRDTAPHGARHGLRRLFDHERLEGRPARGDSRPRPQQDRHRRRPRRPLGRLPRRDGRQHRRERRALVRQRLGRLGHAPRRPDRGGAGRTPRADRPARGR